MRTTKGFTLIELIMVIVILGILAAVAIPMYLDLKSSAQQAAVDAVAGALASGSAINYAAAVQGNPGTITIDDCQTVAQTLQGGVLPTVSGGGNYTITQSSITAGQTATCTVNLNDAQGNVLASATFQAYGATAP